MKGSQSKRIRSQTQMVGSQSKGIGSQTQTLESKNEIRLRAKIKWLVAKVDELRAKTK